MLSAIEGPKRMRIQPSFKQQREQIKQEGENGVRDRGELKGK